MRNICALVAGLALLPLAASASTPLGTLHHGASVIIFTLAGNTVVVEQREAGGARDDLQVPVANMGCTDRDEDGSAFALAAKLNRLARCKS